MPRRKVYKMTRAQRDAILAASQPTPAMFLSGGQPMFPTPQENADLAWQMLADELGFVWNTARPAKGKSDLYFSAVPISR